MKRVPVDAVKSLQLCLSLSSHFDIGFGHVNWEVGDQNFVTSNCRRRW